MCNREYFVHSISPIVHIFPITSGTFLKITIAPLTHLCLNEVGQTLSLLDECPRPIKARKYHVKKYY